MTSTLAKIRKAICFSCLSVCLMGASVTHGCKQTTVIVTPTIGPETQKLIDDQKTQIADLKSKEALHTEQMGQIAGSVYGIDVGITNIKEDSKGKTIVKEENGLIKSVVGEPPAEQRAKADARTISILQDDLAEQTRLYGKAKTEIDTVKQQLSEKDKIIEARNKALADQKTASEEEIAKNKETLGKTITGLQTDIQNLKDEQAAKERRLWINTLRYGGFGIILIGIIALAVTQGSALVPGLILIGSGSLVILIGVAIDIVTSQPWFPYAAAIVGLLIIIGVGWFVWHLYSTHKFAKKSSAVFNDMKTEAEILVEAGDERGEATLALLEPHLKYRFGGIDKLNNIFVKSGLDEKKKPADTINTTVNTDVVTSSTTPSVSA